MDTYNWKDHYDASFEKTGGGHGFDQYRISNATGSGTVTACRVFRGVQAIFNDFSMLRCSNAVRQNRKIIEMAYCLDGRYENTFADRYSFIVSAGDFSVGYAGRRESGGSFPAGYFEGILIILDLDSFAESYSGVLEELKIDTGIIEAFAGSQPRYFKIKHNEALRRILDEFVGAFKNENIPKMRIKVLEILLFLNQSDLEGLKEQPVYLNKRNVALAKAAYQIMTGDISRHITIEQMAADLDCGVTVLKRSFKSVYGTSLYRCRKELQLLEGQRLLRETEYSVSFIALSIGYSNPAKFSSAFKERFGMSPTEYRKQ